MFSSAPASPDHKTPTSLEDPSSLLSRQRSASLTPIERPKYKSAFSTMISKATKKHHKRTESSNLTQDSQSSIFDYDSSMRRSSSKSDATTVSDMDYRNEPSYFQKTQQRQILKSDEEEADRIQLKNDLVKLAFEGEFSLPFDYKDLQSGRILDVGCGPGSWCIDLSQKYPRIEVIGVDSDDMFPAPRNLPNNCQLLVCNVLNGLREFPDASFDVIHIRFMVLSLNAQEYPQVVKDCWRLLKPGGYIEMLETDLTVYSPGPVTHKLNSQMIEVAVSRGLSPKEQANELSTLIPAEAINRQVKYRSIPIGTWGGRIGVLCRDDMINMLTKFQPAVDAYFDKTKHQDDESTQKAFEMEIATIMKEMEQYKSFSNYYFYTAQKPYNTPPTFTSAPPPTPPAILQRSTTTLSVNPKSF
ncbi:hypothetical protein INT47_010556 [Mucor saturninus]|uniref:Methyltransferase domain-containing protein n=1 Tax=Mucor saturninus TaxID=64648 RepID=A0A8H7UWY3_9FUNG|nr:hypothetical protein INT47_010556 [Mucor saturninus]